MATVNITRGSTLPNSSAKSDFHDLVDLASGSISNIVNADVDSAAAIAGSKLDLSAIAQAIVMSSKIINQAKGADVASVAGAMTLGDDGNYFDITGTEAITSITAKQAGTVVTLQFDSTASLVDGSNLKLNGNFTGAAESQITLVSDGTNWFEVSRQPGASTTATNIFDGAVVQVVNTQTGATATGTTAIPFDNTIPQNTEGDEYMTLAITPKSTTNLLIIEVVGVFTGDTTQNGAMALFQDSTAGALAVGPFLINPTNFPQTTSFIHKMTAGTISSTTFKVRAGAAAGTTVFNGVASGQKYGGVSASSITITEIKAS